MLQILYTLQKPLYDPIRKVEYKPLKCMNNQEYAKVCQDAYAKECIYAVNASQNLNSEIAIAFRKALVENKIDLLVSYNVAQEEVFPSIQDYANAMTESDSESVLDFEMPFLETQLMISECADLQYEKMPQTGAIKIYEQGNKRKDRYTSASYGSYFIDQLEIDLLGGNKVTYDVTKLTSFTRKPQLYSKIK